MMLYLVESVLQKEGESKESFEQKIGALEQTLAGHGASLIEVQVAADLSRAFFIVESNGQQPISESFREQNIPIALIKPVRLVGQELSEVKKQAGNVNYLVEWNLPENLTMDKYLERKNKNSVHYAEVPEVSFSRTYVCEDMTKCLCFYDAPDELSVKKAREAVQAPIDSLTKLSNK